MGGGWGVDSSAKDRLVEVTGCWPSQRPSELWPCAEKKGERKRREGGRVQCQAGKRNRLLIDFSQFLVFYFNSCTCRHLFPEWIAHLR